MTAPSYVSSGTESYSSPGTSVACPAPPSLVAGNLLIMFWEGNTGASGVTVPAGWTAGTSQTQGTSFIKYWWKISNGSEGTQTISWTSSQWTTAQIVQYTGNRATSPIGNVTSKSGVSTSWSANALTTSYDSSLVACLQTLASASSNVVPSGFTRSGAASIDMGFSSQVIASSGTVVNASATVASSTWTGWLIEILGPLLPQGITQTLKLVKQSAVGQQWVKATVAQTLKLVTQAARGSTGSLDFPLFVNDAAVYGASSGVTSLTGTLPASRVNGNLLLAIASSSNGGTHTWSSGWTVGGSHFDQSWAWRYVTGTETAPTVSWASHAGGCVVVQQWTNVDPINPIGICNSAVLSGMPYTVASIATVEPNSIVVAAILFTAKQQTMPGGTPAGYSVLGLYNTSANTFATSILTYDQKISSGNSSAINSGGTGGFPVGTFGIELLGAPGITAIVKQTLGLITQAASGTWTAATGATGTVAQTLKALTQSATGALWARGTVVQTLARITQHASGADQFFATIAQTLKVLTQGATGAMWAQGTVAQTLKIVTQAASGTEKFIGTVVQTLKIVAQAASGALWARGTVVQTLARIAQHASGADQFFATIAQTLKLTVQSATGAMWAQGAAAQVLGLVQHAAVGGQTFIGTVAQTLQTITQSATGAMWAQGTATQILSIVTQAARGTAGVLATIRPTFHKIAKKLKSTWHGIGPTHH